MTSTSDKAQARVVVIGAGVGGISFGIALRQKFLGFENFTIYEKESEVAGTWHVNTYPGCSSDIYIHFFSASTDLYPDWEYSHGFQPQIEKYWKSLHRKYDLYSHTEFNTLVTSAEWDPSRKLYHIVTKNLLTGEEKKDSAEVLISALGVLEVVKIPKFVGIEGFKGKTFHSGRWNPDVDLRGKKVAVVGNGASATQFVPVISEDPSTQIVNFIRTPNWFLPPIRSRYHGIEKWLFRYLPFWMRINRFQLFLRSELFYALIFGSPALRKFSTWLAKIYIQWTAPKEYVGKLLPDYTIGCKRVIFDTDYLTCLHRPNVTINFDGIDSLYDEGIITKKGEKIPFDVIIFSTGFETDDYPLYVRGTKETVKQYYDHEGGPKAYLGTTVPGFPNFFLLSGPNTVTGHTSVIYTEECQINYILSLIQPIFEKRISSIDVKPQATDAYNEKIHKRLAKSVFVQCVSWYRKGGTGKVTSIFPGTSTLFWWWLRKVKWDDYQSDEGSKEEWERWVRREKRQRLRRCVKLLAVVLFAAGVRLVCQKRSLLVDRWDASAFLASSKATINEVLAMYNNKLYLFMSCQTVEINDAVFCSQHTKEVCEDCSYDGREENDGFFGFDFIDREALEAPAVTMNKDGQYQCKKHASTACNQCFGWKKQITRARTAAKKAGKK
ncbi:hypothetical protein D9758_010944 [Tetrapyrgos nigripes]|uniref:Flavin-containing monooxygenase n=1 Tax=Tetrapyrgos nigripes TaxID=182062 RepID=A0A8H5CUU5_9AGAR|nr:hypothetical protein D9758_010944 [Tetrapyrgos nigripes]